MLQRKNLLHIFVIILLLTLHLNTISADTNKRYVIKSWGVKNGLPQSTIHKIIQDNRGCIWIATQAGIARFDGSEFRYYRDLYKSRYTLAIHQDKESVLWFGTFGQGLVRLENNKIKVYNTLNSGLKNNIIRAIDSGFDNTLIIGTDKGLFTLKSGMIKRFRLNSLSENIRINTILKCHREQRIYIGTNRGLYALSDKNTLTRTPSEGLNSEIITSLVRDIDGNLWIGTRKGLSVLKKKDNKITTYTKKDGLIDDVVLTVDFSEKSGLLIGTEQGTTILNNNKVENLTSPDFNVGPVYSAIFDREGNFWIAGTGMKMFYKGNISTLTFKRDSFMWALCEMRNGDIWAGSRKGINIIRGYNIRGEVPGFENMRIRSIFQDSSLRIWVGTEYGLFMIKDNRKKHFTSDMGLHSNIIRCFAEDRQGNIWIGSENGLTRYNGSEFKNYTVKDGLNNNTVRNLFYDKEDDTLWVATDEGLNFVKNDKLSCIDSSGILKSGTIRNITKGSRGRFWFSTTQGLVMKDGKKELVFTKKNGLANDLVHQIVDDKRGNLWMSTDDGILYISKRNLAGKNNKDYKIPDLTILTEADGMKNKECNGGNHCSGLISKDGLIYFATVEGISIINPDNFKKIDNEFNIFINSIHIDNREIFPPFKNLTIDAGAKRINFDIFRVCFRSPEKIRLKYLMQGYDTEWISFNKGVSPLFTNLSPGEYKFILSADEKESSSFKETSVNFSKKALFYQTIYFKVLMIILAALIIWIAVKIRTHNLTQYKKELERLVAQRTKELKDATLIDPLTGLQNRRYLAEIIDTEISAFVGLKNYALKNKINRRTMPEDSVFGLIMFDIDHFKNINDTYGHKSGDMVLKKFSSILRKSVREDDVVVRWGGEEFMVILKKTSRSYLADYAEKILQAVNSTQYEILNNKKIHVSCSGGVTGFPFFDSHPGLLTFEQSVILSDSALYYAKNNGRNQCTILFPKNAANLDRENAVRLIKDIRWGAKNNYIDIKSVKG